MQSVSFILLMTLFNRNSILALSIVPCLVIFFTLPPINLSNDFIYNYRTATSTHFCWIKKPSNVSLNIPEECSFIFVLILTLASFQLVSLDGNHQKSIIKEYISILSAICLLKTILYYHQYQGSSYCRIMSKPRSFHTFIKVSFYNKRVNV